MVMMLMRDEYPAQFLGGGKQVRIILDPVAIDQEGRSIRRYDAGISTTDFEMMKLPHIFLSVSSGSKAVMEIAQYGVMGSVSLRCTMSPRIALSMLLISGLRGITIARWHPALNGSCAVHLGLRLHIHPHVHVRIAAE